MKHPQWKLLYWAMKHKKRKLTALDGFKLCGTMNMHKRIDDIEKHLDTYVYKEWKKIGNKRYRVFFMKGSYR